MENKRVELLADYLSIEPEDVDVFDDERHEFETPLGDYLVLTEDEAYDLEKQYIFDLIDDIGYDGFNVNLNDFVTNQDWFEDWFRDFEESYVNDIEYEDDDVFENRLIQECYDADLLSEEDFEEKEDGNPDFKQLKDSIDIDALKEDYVEYILNDIGDFIEEFKWQYGEDYFNQVIKDNNLVDDDALAEYCISMDGVGHNIATYDGREIDLGDGYYAYRTN